jgi:hypothetical protein
MVCGGDLLSHGHHCKHRGAQNRSTDGSVFQKTGMLRAERAERCMLVLRSKCTHLSFMCRTALDLNSDEKVSVNPNLSDLLQQPTAHQCTARISPAVPRVGSEAACGATTLSQTVGQSVSSQPVSSQPASQQPASQSASQPVSQPVSQPASQSVSQSVSGSSCITQLSGNMFQKCFHLAQPEVKASHCHSLHNQCGAPALGWLSLPDSTTASSEHKELLSTRPAH